MKKIATGLTSIPMSSVPGSEDVEINYMSEEDAEAANHGGFNQMRPEGFAKDLEIVKKRRLKKKANFTKKAYTLSEQEVDEFEDIKSYIQSAIVSFNTATGLSVLELPDFLQGDFDPNIDPDKFVKNSCKNILFNVDFTNMGGNSTQSGGIKKSVEQIYSLYTSQIKDLSNGIEIEKIMMANMGDSAGWLTNLGTDWSDDYIVPFGKFLDFMVDYREFYKKMKQKVGTATPPQTSGASGVESTTKIAYPAGTNLEDISGPYTYHVVSDSEVEITKLDGTKVTVTPDTAAGYGVKWDEMVSNLNDQAKTKKSANYIFNIAKVSKNMKEELIKLNSALNGLGYKDLVKTAETNNGLSPGNYYQHKTDGYIVKCVSSYSSGYMYDDETVVTLISPREGVTASSVMVSNMDSSTGCTTGDVIVGTNYNLCDYDVDEWTFLPNYKERAALDSEKQKARKWAVFLTNHVDEIYEGSEANFYTIRSKTQIDIWDDLSGQYENKYNMNNNPSEFIATCNIIFDSNGNLKPGVSLWGHVKTGSNKLISLLKIAGPSDGAAGPAPAATTPAATTPAATTPATTTPAATTPAATTPATTTTPAATGGKPKRPVIGGWDDYVTKSRYGTEPERRDLYSNWLTLTVPDGHQEGGNTYTRDYSSFQKWWTANRSTFKQGGNVAETNALIQSLIASKGAAGASGAETVSDDTLLKYLTTPLTQSQAQSRKTNIIDKMQSIQGAVMSSVGNKQYLGPSVAAAILGNPGWKTTAIKAYTDDLKANDTLSILLSVGVTPDVETATTSPAAQTSGGGTVTGGTVSMANLNGIQYYQIPSGKFNIFVRKGKPYDPTNGIMVQDTRVGRDSTPRSIVGSPRIRDFLGPREMARLLDAIGRVESDKVDAYEAVLKGQRMNQSAWLRFWTGSEKEKAITDAAGKAKESFEGKAAARQSRLDNLKKKGVI